MMGIRKQVDQDLKEAMKFKNSNRTGAIRLIRAEVLKKQKEKSAPGINSDVMRQVLRSMAKHCKESIEHFEKAVRDDLSSKENSHLGTIESYLPEPTHGLMR